MTMIWINAESLEDERRAFKKVIAKDRQTIADLKELLVCYQEGKLEAAFDYSKGCHIVTFMFSEALIEADPEFRSVAESIAHRVKAYIQKQKETGLAKDQSHGDACSPEH